MLKYGGVVIPMQQNLVSENDISVLDSVQFLVGDALLVKRMTRIPVLEPFSDLVVDYLNMVSKSLLASSEAKAYPDIVTFAFWIRKAHLTELKRKFVDKDGDIHVGRGITFHIAPSNVAVNYAYSMVAGLLTGNACIVRVPSKEFPQVRIINDVLNACLRTFEDVKPYVCLVQYGHDKAVNDWFSQIADVRVIWGGDATISEIRQSPIRPRTVEITFADRYSLAVIDSDVYMNLEKKKAFAQDFYNDTYLSDQNACTSPSVLIWLGTKKEEAKQLFWEYEHKLVKEKYQFQPIMGINKLTNSYLAAIGLEKAELIDMGDNYITRMYVNNVDASLMQWKSHSGFFFEYDCDDIMEIRNLCDNTHCQTIGYLGDRKNLTKLLLSGIKGVDRIVPIGKTMDFELIWDGYNIMECLTRTIRVGI